MGGETTVKMWRLGLRKREPEKLERIKPRIQEEGKVLEMRKVISSFEKEIFFLRESEMSNYLDKNRKHTYQIYACY